MRAAILADENIHYSLVRELRRLGIDVVALVEVRRGLKNGEVVELANREGLIILTADIDFLQLRNRIRTGLVVLRVGVDKRNYRRVAETVKQVIGHAWGRAVVV